MSSIDNVIHRLSMNFQSMDFLSIDFLSMDYIVNGLQLSMDFLSMNYLSMDYIFDRLQLSMGFLSMDFLSMDYIVSGLQLSIDFLSMTFLSMDYNVDGLHYRWHSYRWIWLSGSEVISSIVELAHTGACTTSGAQWRSRCRRQTSNASYPRFQDLQRLPSVLT